MRNKFFSLIIGLIVILASPVFTSCVDKAANNDIQTETVITAEVSNALYVAPEVAQCRDVSYMAVQDAVVTEAEDGYNWLGIVNILLAIVAAVFAAFTIRAKAALRKLIEALDDNRLTKEEIQDIVKAWKGK